MASTVGERIKLVRKAHGYSLKDLAARTDTSKSYIFNIESGLSNPTIKKISRIAFELGVTTSYLLDGNTEKEEKITKNTFFDKFLMLSQPDRKRIEEIIDLWIRNSPRAEE
jgi:transcriptional regulator with XRE-family HTH domain